MNSPAAFDGFRLSASPRLSLQRAGEAQEPVLVVDGLMRDPKALIVYRSRLLHSGQIIAPDRLDEDPRRGRLTANFFVIY
jgi:hypothetical protein